MEKLEQTPSLKAEDYLSGPKLFNALCIKKFLGEGAFANVYLASWNADAYYEGKHSPNALQTGNKPINVALKLLYPHFKERSDDQVKMLFKEGRLLSGMDDRNIIKCLGAVKLPLPFPGLKYIKIDSEEPPSFRWGLILEYGEGGTLLHKVAAASHRRRAMYSQRTALMWLRDVAAGLNRLHTCEPKILHRDLKLENVLICGPGPTPVAKLTDFGLHVVLKNHMKTFSSIRSRNSLQGSIRHSSSRGLHEGNSFQHLASPPDPQSSGGTNLAPDARNGEPLAATSSLRRSRSLLNQSSNDTKQGEVAAQVATRYPSANHPSIMVVNQTQTANGSSGPVDPLTVGTLDSSYLTSGQVRTSRRYLPPTGLDSGLGQGKTADGYGNSDTTSVGHLNTQASGRQTDKRSTAPGYTGYTGAGAGGKLPAAESWPRGTRGEIGLDQMGWSLSADDHPMPEGVRNFPNSEAATGVSFSSRLTPASSLAHAKADGGGWKREEVSKPAERNGRGSHDGKVQTPEGRRSRDQAAPVAPLLFNDTDDGRARHSAQTLQPESGGLASFDRQSSDRGAVMLPDLDIGPLDSQGFVSASQLPQLSAVAKDSVLRSRSVESVIDPDARYVLEPSGGNLLKIPPKSHGEDQEPSLKHIHSGVTLEPLSGSWVDVIGAKQGEAGGAPWSVLRSSFGYTSDPVSSFGTQRELYSPTLSGSGVGGGSEEQGPMSRFRLQLPTLPSNIQQMTSSPIPVRSTVEQLALDGWEAGVIQQSHVDPFSRMMLGSLSQLPLPSSTNWDNSLSVGPFDQQPGNLPDAPGPTSQPGDRDRRGSQEGPCRLSQDHMSTALKGYSTSTSTFQSSESDALTSTGHPFPCPVTDSWRSKASGGPSESLAAGPRCEAVIFPAAGNLAHCCSYTAAVQHFSSSCMLGGLRLAADGCMTDEYNNKNAAQGLSLALVSLGGKSPLGANVNDDLETQATDLGRTEESDAGNVKPPSSGLAGFSASLLNLVAAGRAKVRGVRFWPRRGSQQVAPEDLTARNYMARGGAGGRGGAVGSCDVPEYCGRDVLLLNSDGGVAWLSSLPVARAKLAGSASVSCESLLVQACRGPVAESADAATGSRPSGREHRYSSPHQKTEASQAGSETGGDGKSKPSVSPGRGSDNSGVGIGGYSPTGSQDLILASATRLTSGSLGSGSSTATGAAGFSPRAYLAADPACPQRCEINLVPLCIDGLPEGSSLPTPTAFGGSVIGHSHHAKLGVVQTPRSLDDGGSGSVSLPGSSFAVGSPDAAPGAFEPPELSLSSKASAADGKDTSPAHTSPSRRSFRRHLSGNIAVAAPAPARAAVRRASASSVDPDRPCLSREDSESHPTRLREAGRDSLFPDPTASFARTPLVVPTAAGGWLRASDDGVLSLRGSKDKSPHPFLGTIEDPLWHSSMRASASFHSNPGTLPGATSLTHEAQPPSGRSSLMGTIAAHFSSLSRSHASSPVLALLPPSVHVSTPSPAAVSPLPVQTGGILGRLHRHNSCGGNSPEPGSAWAPACPPPATLASAGDQVQWVFRLTDQVGSFLYMAPEVFLKCPYTEKVDVFGFAVLACELLMGATVTQTVAFDSPESYAEQVAAGWRLPRQPNAQITDEVWALICRCWAQDAAARPAMSEVCEQLDRIISALPEDKPARQPAWNGYVGNCLTCLGR